MMGESSQRNAGGWVCLNSMRQRTIIGQSDYRSVFSYWCLIARNIVHATATVHTKYNVNGR
jgi:hypothetical protein